MSPRSECGEALEEVEYLGYSYLNEQWHPDVLASWDEQGCKAEIHRYLGHRLTLDQAMISAAVAPGGELELDLVIGNEGYAALYNERPVYAVIERNSEHHVALLSIDPRRWTSGDTHEVPLRLRIPADAKPGYWRLGLWLPDAADSLRDDPRYAIQLANDGTWEPSTGINWLTRGLNVDPAAPGPVDPSAFEFAEITP